MQYALPSKCPVCGSPLTVTLLTCQKCGSQINGSFAPCRYCALNGKLSLFLETFLRCRGNIKEVERCLGISYPTVKSLLEELLSALFPEEKSSQTVTRPPGEILDMLERGEITADEAAELLSASEKE